MKRVPMTENLGPLVEHYTDLHWGYAPTKAFDTEDEGIPDCTQMGRLLVVQLASGEDVTFPRGSHLGVEHGHPADRLHLIVPRAQREEYAQIFRRVFGQPWAAQIGLPASVRTLGALARHVGGRQAEHPYPNLRCVALGEVSDVVYDTHKQGDPPSHYYHLFGDESGIHPWLAIDEEGRPWLVGGNYTVPPEGITD